MAQFELALLAEGNQEKEDAAQQHCVVPGIALSSAMILQTHPQQQASRQGAGLLIDCRRLCCRDTIRETLLERLYWRDTARERHRQGDTGKLPFRLYPRQLAHRRQIAEDANGPSPRIFAWFCACWLSYCRDYLHICELLRRRQNRLAPIGGEPLE